MINLLLVGSLCIASALGAVTCRNRYGTAVDWFVAYKVPRIDYNSALPGSSLLYADSNSLAWGTVENINSSDCSVTSTLTQYYDALNDLETFYMLYNDEHADGGKKDFLRGHAKGVAVFDSQSGFWLIHSVPNFPSVTSYKYPISGLRNGQSFLCITLNAESLPTFAKQMTYIQPSIYSSQLPLLLAARYPELQSVIAMKPLPKKATVFHSIQPVSSLDGLQFVIFAKHKKFGKDLYADLLAPYLKSSFYVETWMNGPGDLHSTCNASYKVLNVLTVGLDSFIFPNSKDHSKWAVSTDPSKPFICVGDINRQISQTLRSGGTTCLLNEHVWTLFKDSIKKLEKCDNWKRKISGKWNQDRIKLDLDQL